MCQHSVAAAGPSPCTVEAVGEEDAGFVLCVSEVKRLRLPNTLCLLLLCVHRGAVEVVWLEWSVLKACILFVLLLRTVEEVSVQPSHTTNITG